MRRSTSTTWAATFRTRSSAWTTALCSTRRRKSCRRHASAAPRCTWIATRSARARSRPRCACTAPIASCAAPTALNSAASGPPRRSRKRRSARKRARRSCMRTPPRCSRRLPRSRRSNERRRDDRPDRSSTGPMTVDATATRAYVQRVWDDSIAPALTEYIRIPAKSPNFDAQWEKNGHIDRAVSLLQEWSVKRAIEGLTLEVTRLPGRTPVILIDVPGASDEIVLLYGHCDKQPEMVGWAEGL